MKAIVGLLLLGGIGYFLFTSSKVEPEKQMVAATASPTPAVSAASATPKGNTALNKTPNAAKPKEKPKTKLGNTALDLKPQKSK